MAERGESSPAERKPSFFERYGPAALATVLGLVAIEMALLTPMIRYGLDLGWLYTWIAETFAVDVAPAPAEDGSVDGRPGWIAAAVLAWTIRRPFKPLELALAAVLTPAVALLPWFREQTPDERPAEPS
ncbi:MAG: hypothetical protein H6732_09155 [Alphaproteobacteria bacterium]|nr:hypothetical protein [Alphaproteobacteria bacterium]